MPGQNPAFKNVATKKQQKTVTFTARRDNPSFNTPFAYFSFPNPAMTIIDNYQIQSADTNSVSQFTIPVTSYYRLRFYLQSCYNNAAITGFFITSFEVNGVQGFAATSKTFDNVSGIIRPDLTMTYVGQLQAGDIVKIRLDASDITTNRCDYATFDLESISAKGSN